MNNGTKSGVTFGKKSFVSGIFDVREGNLENNSCRSCAFHRKRPVIAVLPGLGEAKVMAARMLFEVLVFLLPNFTPRKRLAGTLSKMKIVKLLNFLKISARRLLNFEALVKD